MALDDRKPLNTTPLAVARGVAAIGRRARKLRLSDDAADQRLRRLRPSESAARPVLVKVRPVRRPKRHVSLPIEGPVVRLAYPSTRPQEEQTVDGPRQTVPASRLDTASLLYAAQQTDAALVWLGDPVRPRQKVVMGPNPAGKAKSRRRPLIAASRRPKVDTADGLPLPRPVVPEVTLVLTPAAVAGAESYRLRLHKLVLPKADQPMAFII